MLKVLLAIFLSKYSLHNLSNAPNLFGAFFVWFTEWVSLREDMIIGFCAKSILNKDAYKKGSPKAANWKTNRKCFLVLFRRF